MDETRVTSPTGGSKGQKLARFDLIPPYPLQALARMYGRGALKYDDRNWERGYNWSLSYAAAMRHLTAFWDGENWDVDPAMPGDPAHHLDAVMFHIMALREFFNKRPEYDDRPAVRNRRSETIAARKAAGMERVSDVSRSPQEGGHSLRGDNAEGEQVPQGRYSPVQASRWEVP